MALLTYGHGHWRTNHFVVTSMCAGNYTVSVRDPSNCVANYSKSIIQPPTFTAGITTTSVNCNGSCTGIINSSPTGEQHLHLYADNSNRHAHNVTAPTIRYVRKLYTAHQGQFSATCAQVLQQPYNRRLRLFLLLAQLRSPVSISVTARWVEVPWEAHQHTVLEHPTGTAVSGRIAFGALCGAYTLTVKRCQ